VHADRSCEAFLYELTKLVIFIPYQQYLGRSIYGVPCFEHPSGVIVNVPFTDSNHTTIYLVGTFGMQKFVVETIHIGGPYRSVFVVIAYGLDKSIFLS